MNPITDVIGGLVGRGREGPAASLEGDALVIDCRLCRLMPVVHSEECIRCMVGAMCDNGSARRIVLRTGRDTEISGSAGSAIRETASVRRWSDPGGRTATRCRGCPASRRAVMDAVWDAFPRGAVAAGRETLECRPEGDRECAECAARTSAALDMVDEGLRRIVSRMRGDSEAGR